MRSFERVIAFWVSLDITVLGLLMWGCGASTWLWNGWLVDPAVARVGFTVVALAAPVAIVRLIQCIANDAFAEAYK